MKRHQAKCSRCDLEATWYTDLLYAPKLCVRCVVEDPLRALLVALDERPDDRKALDEIAIAESLRQIKNDRAQAQRFRFMRRPPRW